MESVPFNSIRLRCDIRDHELCIHSKHNGLETYHGLKPNGNNDTAFTSESAQVHGTVLNDTTKDVSKRNVKRDTNDETAETTTENINVTIETGNQTHRWVLDTSRTLFESDSTCQFAEYMPIMSTIFAAVWLTMFTMCAGGGHVRTGLPQPWRILAPALIFAIVMVGLTGHSFTLTNGGLHDFCAKFYIYTNTTTCSAVNSFLERGWNTAWGMGGRIGATRAASAGVWASWACAAALLLARCLVAPDFQVRRTGAYLLRDPQQKLTPYLKKSPKPRSRSNSSPTKRDNVSMRSEPTLTTELVTVSIEQGQDSVPTSLMATPIKSQRNSDMIEMTYSPRERMSDQQ
ncbi:hypothetical protein K1T71_010890 [Dendrolimus kikuchii]|uniref:Uncharacterized protein n=1 Tax=Dendrolimus kikuchii TaxID=765133 RepID=A0ACC1CQB8_9NEOP|nr:hypothetical protein K1T71_010890 [Dendrolimus kikuchii]